MASFASSELGFLLLPSRASKGRLQSGLSLTAQTSKSLVSFSSLVRDGSANVVCMRTRHSPFSVLAGARHLIGSLTRTEGLRFAVVIARFNEIVTKLLLEGALETFKRYSVKEEDIDVIWVPGSFEIPVAAQRLGKSGNYNAVICIGAVIRGDTTHYDAVANSAASGVLSAGLSSGKNGCTGDLIPAVRHTATDGWFSRGLLI